MNDRALCRFVPSTSCCPYYLLRHSPYLASHRASCLVQWNYDSPSATHVSHLGWTTLTKSLCVSFWSLTTTSHFHGLFRLAASSPAVLRIVRTFCRRVPLSFRRKKRMRDRWSEERWGKRWLVHQRPWVVARSQARRKHPLACHGQTAWDHPGNLNRPCRDLLSFRNMEDEWAREETGKRLDCVVRKLGLGDSQKDHLAHRAVTENWVTFRTQRWEKRHKASKTPSWRRGKDLWFAQEGSKSH